MKLKDSYNLDMLSQELAKANFADTEYRKKCVEKIISERVRLTEILQNCGFKVIPSQANFLFAAPPDGDGKSLFEFLRSNAVIVRYFPGTVTGKYLRITIGTPEENDILLRFIREKFAC